MGPLCALFAVEQPVAAVPPSSYSVLCQAPAFPIRKQLLMLQNKNSSFQLGSRNKQTLNRTANLPEKGVLKVTAHLALLVKIT